MSEQERRYSDDEVAEILTRAVQPIASSALPATRSTEGITLEELTAVATEAGIDPARVRSAALELGEGSSTPDPIPFFGAGNSYVFDRVVHGEVPRERFSDLVSIIRRRLRAKGKVEEIGDWLEWTSDGTSIHITVRPGNGRTTIQFMGDAGFRLVGTYGPITLATLITLVGLGNSGSLGIGLAVTILAGAYLLARTLWGAASRAAGRMYRRMIDDITGDVARLVDAASRDDGPT